MLDPSRVKAGDVLISLASGGLHSNGFSLVRKVLDIEHADLHEWSEELGCELGAELLAPTSIYVKPVLDVLEIADVHGVSHITGGGFFENVPRMLPEGLRAKIDKSSLWIYPIFRMIQRLGEIPERDMFNTFNMGTGMVLAVGKNDADRAIDFLRNAGQAPRVIGEVVPGGRGVELL